MSKFKKVLHIDKRIEDFFKSIKLKRKKTKPKRSTVIITKLVIIAFLIFLIYFSGIIKSSCPDEECFEKAFQACKPIKYVKSSNNNVYEHQISRSLFTTCNMKITMKKSAPGTDLDVKKSIEGKSMNCKVPKYLIRATKPGEFENLVDYCTGPLKEGMYEIMIKKAYGLIVANMGEIVEEMQTTLRTI